ncbi:MAG: SufE family protein [Nevskia sp.]|jgi:cysteine desulfuration protein SufE|nr:SufE family protein [Nevskia sp.]
MNLEQLAETFDLLGDWEERYRYLIELGRKLPPLPEAARTETNKVRGCMSQVWLVAETEPGPPLRLRLRGDSDAHLVKGLIAVLFALYDGRTPREILDTDLQGAFARLGLENHLTMNRRNGFYAMVERIRSLARAAERAAA